ncbi:MAG: hypothetical protein M3N46_14030 [Actinomycetota bacterium]|nr:hypothetical protein [Actinomycetota bacterium]
MPESPEVPRPYVANKPARRPSNEELRRRIPGWGADLETSDRPDLPDASFRADESGAHWELPERQEEIVERERSIEHGMLPPVFGTAAPLHGVSGRIRRVAYARFSEARLAHWLLLIVGDRVDAFGAHVGSVLHGGLGNPVDETGVRAELSGDGRSGGNGRGDRQHRWIDPFVVAGPWIISALVAWRVLRGVLHRR